ncbi:hypothetical protein ES705_26701 [subsurface metagenome]
MATSYIFNGAFISMKIGCQCSGSIVNDSKGRLYWYASDNTFKEISAGAISGPIQTDIVDKIFQASVEKIRSDFIDKTEEVCWSIPFDNILNNKVITFKEGIWGQLDLAIPAFGSMKKLILVLISIIFLSGCWLFPDINGVNEMEDIDVGLAAIVRNMSCVQNMTYIVEGNPVTGTGTITRVEIYAKEQFTGLQIGIFYSTGTNRFSTRSTVTITTGVVTAGYHIYTVNLAAQAGDRIGFMATTGDNIAAGVSDAEAHWRKSGDHIPCSDVEFTHLTYVEYGLISLYGYSFYAPTVTTQAVSDISSTTSTGNGNITDIGSVNPTKRGICWNTTGSPTVADSKSEETGTFGTGAFTRPMTGLDPGVQYFVKAYAYNEAGYGYGGEVNFTTHKIAPSVTTQDATEVSQNQVKGNGNITDLGGENSLERGFEYGYTKTATWTEKETGSYPAVAFYLTIDGLQANTEYWYRAYAKNLIGTGHGEWVKFQTSATGVIPTGTKVSICSDYSGMTYKLNSAFTDDGNGYESYFVLSTDLAQKQGLHINKRLEDIFSYFAKKESGTAKIYIKRDNEAEWQYAGEISMAGDEDIIVKHLPSDNEDSIGDVDFLAKHFLVKFVFENDFEFIGLVTEAIYEGAR